MERIGSHRVLPLSTGREWEVDDRAHHLIISEEGDADRSRGVITFQYLEQDMSRSTTVEGESFEQFDHLLHLIMERHLKYVPGNPEGDSAGYQAMFRDGFLRE